MNLQSHDFDLFDVAVQFKQDRAVLDARWRALQAQVHPDRFIDQGAAAQRLSMQWAVRVNEAYQRLKNPLKRAAYLCELAGFSIKADNNTAMPTEFLIQQMDDREALAQTNTLADMLELEHQVSVQRDKLLDHIEYLIDGLSQYADAAQQVRALMFVERFAQDVEDRLAQWEPIA
jgi:molecular chaperone HscB